MTGAIVLVVVLVFVLPSLVLMSFGALAGVMGWFLTHDAEERHEGSELIELNR